MDTTAKTRRLGTELLLSNARLTLLVVCMFLVFCQTHVVRGSDYCRADRISSGPGPDQPIYLGCILNLHDQVDGRCGQINPVSFQLAVSLNWALDKLNGNGNMTNTSYIPGVKLGLTIFDDCGLELLATKHLAEMLDVGEAKTCLPDNDTSVTHVLTGILGTSLSQTTTTVARLLTNIGIPMLGISATLPELSDRTQYPNFIRAVPSDAMQSRAILRAVQQFDWTYIIGMHTNDNYGTQGFEEFRRLGEEDRVCIATTYVIDRADKNLRTSLETIVRRLFVKLLDTSNKTIGVVFYGHGQVASQLFRAVTDRRTSWLEWAEFNKIHWIMSDGVGLDRDLLEESNLYTSKIFVISAAFNILQDFEDYYLNLLRNADSSSVQERYAPWINEYMANLYGCNILNSGSNSQRPVCDLQRLDLKSKYSFYSYNSAALDVLYFTAKVLKEIHDLSCKGQSGPCSDFIEFLKSGNDVPRFNTTPHLDYANINDAYLPQAPEYRTRQLVTSNDGNMLVHGEPLYFLDVIEKQGQSNTQQFVRVGNYSNNNLSMNAEVFQKLSPMPTSACRSVCKQCLQEPFITFAFQPGDVYILGIFSVHSPGTGDSFSCGEYRRESASVFPSILALLSTVRNSPPTKNGNRFGAIVVDDCYNPLRISLVLNEILSGRIKLRDPQTNSSIDISKVIAVVGPESSGASLAALPVLTGLGIPVVSHFATSPDMDDRINYPYFLRTVPSDKRQAASLLQIAKLLGVTHLAAINIDNNYGRRAMQVFLQMAEEAKICVDTPYVLSENPDSTALLSKVINEIKSRGTKVVIFFSLDTMATDLLDLLGNDDENLIFLSSEGWGKNAKVISGRRGFGARGSIVLAVDSTFHVHNNFREYLGSLIPENDTTIPWLRDFWQETFQCNLPGGFQNTFISTCAADLRMTEAMQNEFASDQRVVHILNAVKSIITGFTEVQELSCPSTSWTRCPRPKASDLWYAIKSVRLTSSNGIPFKPFLEDGNGNIGFQFYNVQKKTTNTYDYVEVGTYDMNQKLHMNRNDLKFYDVFGNVVPLQPPSCRYVSNCRVCADRVTTSPSVTENKTGSGNLCPEGQSESQESDTLVPAIIVLALFLMILFICLLIIVVLIIRRNISLTNYVRGRESNRVERVRYEGLVFERPLPDPPSNHAEGSSGDSVHTSTLSHASMARAVSVPSSGYEQGRPVYSHSSSQQDVNSILGSKNTNYPVLIQDTQPSAHTNSSSSSLSVRNVGYILPTQRSAQSSDSSSGSGHRNPAYIQSSQQSLQASDPASGQGYDTSGYIHAIHESQEERDNYLHPIAEGLGDRQIRFNPVESNTSSVSAVPFDPNVPSVHTPNINVLHPGTLPGLPLNSMYMIDPRVLDVSQSQLPVNDRNQLAMLAVSPGMLNYNLQPDINPAASLRQPNPMFSNGAVPAMVNPLGAASNVPFYTMPKPMRNSKSGPSLVTQTQISDSRPQPVSVSPNLTMTTPNIPTFGRLRSVSLDQAMLAGSLSTAPSVSLSPSDTQNLGSSGIDTGSQKTNSDVRADVVPTPNSAEIDTVNATNQDNANSALTNSTDMKLDVSGEASSQATERGSPSYVPLQTLVPDNPTACQTETTTSNDSSCV